MPSPIRPFNLTADELDALSTFLETATEPPESQPISDELLALLPRFSEFLQSVSPAITKFLLKAPDGNDVLIVTR